MQRSTWDRRWAEPEWHPTLASTNATLREDPVPGRVVVADHQSQGAGRLGRSWTAPPDTALAISVAVPAPKDPAAGGWVPLVTGLAVVRALADSRYAVEARLKWPNDVLVRDGTGWGKVGGILAQQTRDPRHGPVVVVGTGLNVDQVREQLPVATATSWRLARGGAVLPDGAREAFVHDYLDRLLAVLAPLLDEAPGEGLERLRADYRLVCSSVGRRVRVQLPAGEDVVGVAREVADDGRLVVVDSGGLEHRFSAGDVRHLRPGD